MKKLFCLCAAICCTVLFSAELPEQEKSWVKGLDNSWLIHYDEAVEKAGAEGKNILILKMESDGNPACAKMQKELLKKAKFKSFAANRYILLWIDVPKKKKLPPKQQKHNSEVVKKLKLGAAPQIKIINIDGVVLGTLNGYTKEKAVMTFLRKTSQKRGTLLQRSEEEEK